MKRLKKILGSKHAKQPITSAMPPSVITSQGSESEPTSISSSTISKRSFFRRRRRNSDSHLKPPETSASAPSSVGDHRDTINIPTVESIAVAPTVGIPLPPEHPDETGSESQAAIVTTVPKIADIPRISEGEVHPSNTATQSVLQGAYNVNLADATLIVVGGDQINYAGTHRTSC